MISSLPRVHFATFCHVNLVALLHELVYVISFCLFYLINPLAQQRTISINDYIEKIQHLKMHKQFAHFAQDEVLCFVWHATNTCSKCRLETVCV